MTLQKWCEPRGEYQWCCFGKIVEFAVWTRCAIGIRLKCKYKNANTCKYTWFCLYLLLNYCTVMCQPKYSFSEIFMSIGWYLHLKRFLQIHLYHRIYARFKCKYMQIHRLHTKIHVLVVALYNTSIPGVRCYAKVISEKKRTRYVMFKFFIFRSACSYTIFFVLLFGPKTYKFSGLPTRDKPTYYFPC